VSVNAQISSKRSQSALFQPHSPENLLRIALASRGDLRLTSPSGPGRVQGGSLTERSLRQNSPLGVGALTMALIQVVRVLIPIRGYFHRQQLLQLLEWLGWIGHPFKPLDERSRDVSEPQTRDQTNWLPGAKGG
jgi:hypothetical protein